MDLHGEDPALRLHKEMLLAALHLLHTIIASLPTDPCRLDPLAVDDAGARLCLAPQSNAERLTEPVVYPLPRAVLPPKPEGMLNSLIAHDARARPPPAAQAG
jgi:hypothetical protein